MKETVSSRKTHLRIVCLSVIAVTILVITLGVAARNQRTAGATGKQRVEVEIVTLGADGFQPTQITRSPGLFLLAVDNSAELEKLQLRLNPAVTDLPGNSKPSEVRVQEPSLFDVKLPKERRNLDQLLELPPGNYVLTEASHPDWVCRITITAR